MQPLVNTEEFPTGAPQVVHSRQVLRTAETGSFSPRSTATSPPVMTALWRSVGGRSISATSFRVAGRTCVTSGEAISGEPWARLRSLVRSAPAGVADDLRQLTVAARAAGAPRLAGASLLVEHDHLVVQRDVSLRPAEHLDRRGQFAAGLPRERLHPAEDLHSLVGDSALALPALRHARPSCPTYDLHSPGRTP